MSRIRRRATRGRVMPEPTPEQRAEMAAKHELLLRRGWSWGPGRGTPAGEAVTAATMRLRMTGWTHAGVLAELERLDREHPGWPEPVR